MSLWRTLNIDEKQAVVIWLMVRKWIICNIMAGDGQRWYDDGDSQYNMYHDAIVITIKPLK